MEWYSRRQTTRSQSPYGSGGSTRSWRSATYRVSSPALTEASQGQSSDLTTSSTTLPIGEDETASQETLVPTQRPRLPGEPTYDTCDHPECHAEPTYSIYGCTFGYTAAAGITTAQAHGDIPAVVVASPSGSETESRDDGSQSDSQSVKIRPAAEKGKKSRLKQPETQDQSGRGSSSGGTIGSSYPSSPRSSNYNTSVDSGGSVQSALQPGKTLEGSGRGSPMSGGGSVMSGRSGRSGGTVEEEIIVPEERDHPQSMLSPPQPEDESGSLFPSVSDLAPTSGGDSSDILNRYWAPLAIAERSSPLSSPAASGGEQDYPELTISPTITESEDFPESYRDSQSFSPLDETEMEQSSRPSSTAGRGHPRKKKQGVPLTRMPRRPFPNQTRQDSTDATSDDFLEPGSRNSSNQVTSSGVTSKLGSKDTIIKRFPAKGDLTSAPPRKIDSASETKKSDTSLDSSKPLSMFIPMETNTDGEEMDEEHHTCPYKCSSKIICPCLCCVGAATCNTICIPTKKGTQDDSEGIYDRDVATEDESVHYDNFLRKQKKTMGEIMDEMFYLCRCGYDKRLTKLCRLITKNLKKQLHQLPKGYYNQTCLHVAVLHQNAAAASVLIQYGGKELVIQEYQHKEYRGLTTLHLAVEKGMLGTIREMLDVLSEEEKHFYIHKQASGKFFTNTYDGIGIPLILSVWCGYNDIFDELLLEGADMSQRDANTGNNIIHSLVLYAKHSPESACARYHDILNSPVTLKWWARCLCKQDPCLNKRDKIRMKKKLLFQENSSGLTPLMLACHLGATKMIQTILDTRDVYCYPQWEYELASLDYYDVSEMESSASRPDRRWKATGLDLLVYGPHKDNTELFIAEPVKTLVEARWQAYSFLFWVMALLHLVLMILFTVCALHDRPKINHPDAKLLLVICELLTLALSLIFFALEVQDYINCTLVDRERRSYGQIFHPPMETCTVFKINSYRIQVLCLSLFIFAWFISRQLESPYAIIFAIPALIIGWISILFYTRAFKGMAIFNYLNSKVFWGNFFHFLMVIFLVIIVFASLLFCVVALTEEIGSSPGNNTLSDTNYSRPHNQRSSSHHQERGKGKSKQKKSHQRRHDLEEDSRDWEEESEGELQFDDVMWDFTKLSVELTDMQQIIDLIPFKLVARLLVYGFIGLVTIHLMNLLMAATTDAYINTRRRKHAIWIKLIAETTLFLERRIMYQCRPRLPLSQWLLLDRISPGVEKYFFDSISPSVSGRFFLPVKRRTLCDRKGDHGYLERMIHEGDVGHYYDEQEKLSKVFGSALDSSISQPHHSKGKATPSQLVNHYTELDE